MCLHYYQATGSLYIDLSDEPSVESQEVSPGVVLDYDEAGHVCGIDIDYASQKYDLSRIELERLAEAGRRRSVEGFVKEAMK